MLPSHCAPLPCLWAGPWYPPLSLSYCLTVSTTTGAATQGLFILLYLRATFNQLQVQPGGLALTVQPLGSGATKLPHWLPHRMSGRAGHVCGTSP